ncbi:hypothetical protein [Bdellovibrio sp. HCB-162]|uniref:hypothetical protein n=1 Tax=Bdellovibrio sp. HCB-162 TaxID=3394234 RepID=UPI0039BD465B
MKYFFVLVLFLFANKSFAYPEMIRHGYVNCMACHTTHQGGDMLSQYGRELGKELFSRNDSIFKASNTEKNYWEIETPEWLRVGANVRLLQTMTENSMASKGRFMFMQVDIDTLFKVNDKTIVYASVGRYEPSKSDAEWRDFIYMPRAWAQYSENWRGGAVVASLRAGRFYPVYGLNIAEHTYVTRRYLDFNPGQERVSAELAWSNENYQVVATGLAQRARFDKYDDEKGYVLQVSKVFGKTARAGVNIYRSKLTQAGGDQDKAFEGVFALIGWTPEISTLFQADKIYYPDGKTGFVDFLKFGYEYTQGVQLFLTQEYYNADTEKTDPHVESYGVGVQYFPFPNFDFFATYKKTKDSSQLDEHQNVVWLIAHIYL